MNRSSSKFKLKYANWLDSDINFPDLCIKTMDPPSKIGEKTSNENENNPKRLITACRYGARKSGE